MRRLKADYELMQDLKARSDLISFKAVDARPGVPPERYIVTFACKSISSVDRSGNPQFSTHHQVEIYLHNQYPQRWPGMKWLTPIWHPNINHLNGTVCIDAAWWTASITTSRRATSWRTRSMRRGLRIIAVKPMARLLTARLASRWVTVSAGTGKAIGSVRCDALPQRKLRAFPVQTPCRFFERV